MGKIKHHFFIALFIACLAAAVQLTDQLLYTYMPVQGSGYGWIAFLAWAVYFFNGCTVKGGIRSAIAFFLGMIGGIVIFTVSGWLSGLGFFATPLALALTVPFMIYLEIPPEWTNSVPAFFVGCGTFFGCMMYISGATYRTVLITEGIYLLIGLLAGWITIMFRGWYSTRFPVK